MGAEGNEQLNLEDWAQERQEELQRVLDKEENYKGPKLRDSLLDISDQKPESISDEVSGIFSSILLRRFPIKAERSDLSLAYETIFLPQKEVEQKVLSEEYREFENQHSTESKKVDLSKDHNYEYSGTYYEDRKPLDEKQGKLSREIYGAIHLMEYLRGLEESLRVSSFQSEEAERIAKSREEYIQGLIEKERERKDKLVGVFEEHEITTGADENEKVEKIVNVVARLGKDLEGPMYPEIMADTTSMLNKLSIEIKSIIPDSKDLNLLLEHYEEKLNEEWHNFHTLVSEKLDTENTDEKMAKMKKQEELLERLGSIIIALRRII